MGRHRSEDVLWSNQAGDVYVRPCRGAYSVFDTRGPRRLELSRGNADDAIGLARSIAAEPARALRVPTLAELAADYFERGVPLWNETHETALDPEWVEQMKGLLRNYYTEFLWTPVDELPSDFIARAETLSRARERSVSHQNKTVGVGHRLVEYARALGLIPWEATYPRLIQRTRDLRPHRKGQGHTVKKHNLPSLREVLLFSRAFGVHTGRRDLRRFWWIAFFIGLRAAELCALRPDDIFEQRSRTRIRIDKKIARAVGDLPERIEPYTKGYEHREVVVPGFLERSLRAQRDLAIANGWEHLFAPWRRGANHPWISLGSVHDAWVTVGAAIGWEVATWTEEKAHPQQRRNRTVTYKPRPRSLVYTPHNARAFAATTMHQELHAHPVHGMGMQVEAIARQLGDTPETVRAHYLGIIEDSDTYLDRVVP